MSSDEQEFEECNETSGNEIDNQQADKLNYIQESFQKNQIESGNPYTDLYQMDDPDDDQIQNNPWVLSFSDPVGKNSFIDFFNATYQITAPPPKYFTDEFLKSEYKFPEKKVDILLGFEYQPDGGLICNNKEMMEKQKGVLSQVVKQLAINLIKGLGLSHISLPIKIFEPTSNIQRLVDLWSFAPLYLKKAGQTSDNLERLKLVIAFSISSIYLCINQNKPFNPLLGETLQANFQDGTKIYCEHTSHHPPMTNFLVEDIDNLYTLSGYYEYAGSMGNNCLTSGMRGPNQIIFKDGQTIRFGFPSFRLGGIVYGDRTIETIGSCTFEDIKNNRRAVILMNSYKKTGWFRSSVQGKKDQIEGIIYDATQIIETKEAINKNYCKDIEFVTDLQQLSDVKNKICNISGSWLNSLQIDNKTYWDIDNQLPQRQQASLGDEILPSDWRYREDLIWLKYGYELIANQWKQRLETQQRHDRAKRQTVDKLIGRKRH